jgi:Cu/Ag efflux protein CusF
VNLRTVSFVLPLTFLCVCACGHREQAPEHVYSLSGKVVALNAKDQTVTIDGAAVPNWMEAMTMEYPVKSAENLKALRVGEKIRAKINVRGPGEYTLTDITEDKAAR